MLAWWGKVTSEEIFISALTVGEIRLGIERLRRRDTVRAGLLEQWLHGLQTVDQDHIVNVDARIAEECGRRKAPSPLPVIDGLLAATAKARGLILVTRNTADLARSGVPCSIPSPPGAAAPDRRERRARATGWPPS